MNETQKTTLGIPLAIIAAGFLIAGAIYLKAPSKAPLQLAQTTGLSIESVNAADKVFGAPNAEITVIEYSDMECPFCKVFHNTMKDIMDTYAKNGRVAWAYRHFPLYKPNAQGQSLHSKAGKEAEATECAYELGGNTAFWKYTNEIYRITPSNNRLELDLLPKVAGEQGLDLAKFTSCLNSGKYAQKISEDYDKAIKAGATGTPYVVVETKKKLSENAQKAVVSRITEELVKLKPGTIVPSDIVSFDESGTRVIWSGAFPKEVIVGIIETLLL